MSEALWTTADGRSLKISEMHDNHLLNTARFLIRKIAEQFNFIPQSWDDVVPYVYQAGHEILFDIMDEVERRGLYFDDREGFAALISEDTWPICEGCGDRKFDCRTRVLPYDDHGIYCRQCYEVLLGESFAEEFLAMNLLDIGPW